MQIHIKYLSIHIIWYNYLIRILNNSAFDSSRIRRSLDFVVEWFECLAEDLTALVWK